VERRKEGICQTSVKLLPMRLDEARKGWPMLVAGNSTMLITYQLSECTCIPLCCGSTVPLLCVQQMIDRLVSFPYVDHRRSIGA